MAELARLQAFIQGRVQGVFFRAAVENRAAELDLTGYVRNLSGDMVEVAAEGEKIQLEKLAEYIGIGPPAARVDDIKLTWSNYTGEFTGFRIRYN